jgi:hypothetical protein
MSIRPRVFRQAGNTIQLSISNASQVQEIFRKLTPELKRDALEAGLFIASVELQQAARAAAPRGTGPEKKLTRSRGGIQRVSSYGRLFSNISRRRVKQAPQPTVRIGVGKAFWGRFIESGWNLTKRAKGKAPRVLKAIPARPWFGPAIAAATPRFVAAFGQYVQVTVIGAALRLSRSVGAQNATRLRPGRNG